MPRSHSWTRQAKQTSAVALIWSRIFSSKTVTLFCDKHENFEYLRLLRRRRWCAIQYSPRQKMLYLIDNCWQLESLRLTVTIVFGVHVDCFGNSCDYFPGWTHWWMYKCMFKESAAMLVCWMKFLDSTTSWLWEHIISDKCIAVFLFLITFSVQSKRDKAL